MNDNIDDTEISTDVEFEQLLEDKRHKEIKGLFKKLIEISQKDDDVKTEKAILRTNELIGELKNEISKLELKSPDININQSEVKNAVEKIGKDINDSLNELNRLKKWSFEFTRDYRNGGVINSPIIATQIK